MFDEQVVRLQTIGDLADDFVRVRLLRITGVDLNLFEFDFDLTWAAFFLNADGTIYGRYGGRDAKGPDTRNTLAGLKYAMQAALDAHHRRSPPAPQHRPFYIESLPTAKQFKGCIHCHYIKEIRWSEDKAANLWNREEIWSYPLPENIGITLELDRGNVVKAVTPGSAAASAGIETGDVINTIGGLPVHSFADVQYALHRAPSKGEIAVTWQRGHVGGRAMLKLAEGWRRTNITWRPSLLDLLPSLRVYGSDLNGNEKKALGLGEKRLAFRQEKPIHSEAQAAGIRENDIITGIDNQTLEMTVDDFLGYVRRNYLIGDQVTLNVIRDGKRLQLPMKLK
jgi:serine protease Do